MILMPTKGSGKTKDSSTFDWILEYTIPAGKPDLLHLFLFYSLAVFLFFLMVVMTSHIQELAVDYATVLLWSASICAAIFIVLFLSHYIAIYSGINRSVLERFFIFLILVPGLALYISPQVNPIHLFGICFLFFCANLLWMRFKGIPIFIKK